MFKSFDDKRKLLVLHIGMAKCGSTSIQKFLNQWNNHQNPADEPIKYITYPGQPDVHPIIADYLDLTQIQQYLPYITERLENHPLDIPVTEYLIREVVNSQAKVTIISSELIAHWLGDQEAEKLITAFKNNISDSIHIAVVCYFRQPASSRFISNLQEQGKYNSEITLYVPDSPFSENTISYKRWEKLCKKYHLSWHPRLFKRSLLVKEDIVADFSSLIETMSGIKIKSLSTIVENQSVDPILLSSFRHSIASYYNYLDFSSKWRILKTLSTLGAKYLADKGYPPQKWTFHPNLEQYINYISQEEELLSFENYQPKKLSQSEDVDKNQLTLDAVLPTGVIRKNGYLTGDLEAFLVGLDEEVIKELTLYLKIATIEMASWYDIDRSLTFTMPKSAMFKTGL